MTGLPDVQPRPALSWWQPWLALGLFSFLLFLFIRALPMISVHEMRKFLTEKREQEASA